MHLRTRLKVALKFLLNRTWDSSGACSFRDLSEQTNAISRVPMRTNMSYIYTIYIYTYVFNYVFLLFSTVRRFSVICIKKQTFEFFLLVARLMSLKLSLLTAEYA